MEKIENRLILLKLILIYTTILFVPIIKMIIILNR